MRVEGMTETIYMHDIEITVRGFDEERIKVYRKGLLKGGRLIACKGLSA